MYETTRCTDNNMRNVTELTGLQHHVDTARNDSRAQVQVLSTEGLKLLVNLVCQLSRRRDYEGEYAIGVLR